MPKKKFFSNIFSRSSKQQRQNDFNYDPNLETDAVPMPDENSSDEATNRVEEINNSTPFPSLDLSVQENSQQFASTPIIASPSPLDVVNANRFPPGLPAGAVGAMLPNNNNMLAINNIQAQNFFQFSNINNLQIGSVYKIGASGGSSNPSDQKEASRSTKEKTRTIQEMLQSTEPINERYLNEISKHLGEGWQDIMRQLKFSEGQIHQAIVDFHIDGKLKEVIYQLLLDWSQNEENPPTLGEITTILWKNGHNNTVQYLKRFYKAQKNANIQSSEERRQAMAKGLV